MFTQLCTVCCGVLRCVSVCCGVCGMCCVCVQCALFVEGSRFVVRAVYKYARCCVSGCFARALCSVIVCVCVVRCVRCVRCTSVCVCVLCVEACVMCALCTCANLSRLYQIWTDETFSSGAQMTSIVTVLLVVSQRYSV